MLSHTLSSLLKYYKTASVKEKKKKRGGDQKQISARESKDVRGTSGLVRNNLEVEAQQQNHYESAEGTMPSSKLLNNLPLKPAPASEA